MSKIIKLSENLVELLQKIKKSSAVANLILESTVEGHSLPVIENGVDYLSISESDTNKISYLSCDRINSISENDYWISGKRYHISPAKIVSKLFDKSILNFINSKDIEIFSNVYRSCQVDNKVNFQIVKGNEIKTYYSYNKYAKNSYGELCGSLGASCMKHDRCQDYFSIYTDNKEVSLLCLLDKETNLLIGRALLWDIEADDINLGRKSFKIMDRIYTTNDDFYTSLFKNWANKNGYYHKSEQNFNNCVWFEKDGKKVDLYLSLKLSTNCKYYPYLDTFKFFNETNSILYNYPTKEVNNLKIFNSTEGYLNKGNDYCFDDITKIVYHISETAQLYYLDNKRVFHGNLVHSYVNDCYIYKLHAEYDYSLEDYIFNKEYDSLNDKERINKLIEERKNHNEKMKSVTKLFSLDESIYDESDLETETPIQETDLLIDVQSTGRPSRRTPGPSRRPPTLTPPGVSATDYDEDVAMENNTNNEETNEETINNSSYTRYISGLVQSLNTTYNGRIYQTLVNEYINNITTQTNGEA